MWTLPGTATRGARLGRDDLRHLRHAGSDPASLHLHGDVVVRVPPLGLLPPCVEEMAKAARSALPQSLGAGFFQVQTLVEHFMEFGHDQQSTKGD